MCGHERAAQVLGDCEAHDFERRFPKVVETLQEIKWRLSISETRAVALKPSHNEKQKFSAS